MLLTALVLMATGLVVSMLGFSLFKLLLPVVGLVTGTIAGFTGFQGVFGSGAVSSTVAVFFAITVGLVLALLSFAFFELAVVVLSGIVGAMALSYLGVAIGLNGEGVVVFLMSVAGFILGASLASSGPMSASLVMTITAFAGVAFMLAGILLVAGDVSLNDLHDKGVVSSVVRVVDQSFLWLFVWFSGSLIARQIQMRIVLDQMVKSSYSFDAKGSRK